MYNQRANPTIYYRSYYNRRKKFPDAAFREYVSVNFDKNSDTSLSADEISDVTEIFVNSNQNIKDLTGIEHFNCSKIFALLCHRHYRP